jgi:hypothetical protein
VIVGLSSLLARPTKPYSQHGAGSVIALNALAPVELLDLHTAKPEAITEYPS